MLKPREVDAKRILEEDFGDYDGLVSSETVWAPLRAGETGTVVHRMTFQRRPRRRITGLVLALRGKRYIKSLWGLEPEEMGFERRITLHLNDRPLPFRLGARQGDGQTTRTRFASEWTWVRLELEDADFAIGDVLTLTFRFDERVPVPTVAIEYLVPVFLEDERGTWYVEAPLSVRVVGTDAVKLCVDVASIVRGDRVRLRVAALDRIGNLSAGFEDVLLCRLGERVAYVEMWDGRAESDAFLTPAEGMHRVTVEGLGSGLTGRSNCFLADPEGRLPRLVWGDIHGHSISSDGIGTLDEHYTHARDVRFMDVASVTDHDNQIIANGAWPAIQRAACRWSDPGYFIVLPAYEWAQPYEAERNYGHKNLYFGTYAGNPLLSGDAADGTDAETSEKLYEKLDPGDCVIISHHPAYESWMWTDWDRLRTEREEVIEVYSRHGASDEPETIKPLPDSNEERFIFRNLRERTELQLGFVGGSDVHAGLIAQDFHPDRAAPEDKKWFKPWRGGLTALWVEELALDAVLDALRRRQTWATTGEKLLLLFEVNGRLFKPEVQAEGPVELRVRFGGAAPVRRLEIFRNARLRHTAEALPETFDYTWTDDRCDGPATYFARVTQEDDQMAWSAVVRVK